MSNFSAHDLSKAFKDGIVAERTRLLDILKKEMMARIDSEDATAEYLRYVKLFNQEDHWDIGEI